MRTLATLVLITVAVSGCSTGHLVGADSCTTVADCPVNTGAACAQTCLDGSNPCVNACTDHQCVARGCPNSDLGTPTCNVPTDCPINTGADCAQTCADGSNPCVNTCLNHQCVMRGCPSTDLGATTCAAAGGQCVALTATPGCPNGHVDGTYACAVGASCCIPSSDAGTCQPNGNACTTAGQCCSNNCITRVSPGFCCEPGGCP